MTLSTMRKCLFLMLVLFASTAINVAAQEQNNPLLNRVLDRIQQLQNEVTELRNQNELTQYNLKILKKNLDAQLMELKTHIGTSDTTPTVSSQAAQVSPADIRIKQHTDDLQKINQNINQINNRLDKLDNLVKTLQSEIPPIPETPAVEEQQPEPAQTEETTPEIKTKASPVEDIKLPDENEYDAYSRAMSALDSADYTRLRDNLSRFLQDYPDGDYTDDANYWFAEAYYAEGNLDLAESYFTQLIEKYSDSEKHESALLKIAYIRLQKEQWEAARNVLELLKNESEDKQIRKLAIEQLEQLKSKGY
ncbi:MAG: tetratricopeptide repeat protein [Gammaproteobacteria bacterium]|nr:tetratricopeptide repeat protein [Gammaproteobacteria bacterium]